MDKIKIEAAFGFIYKGIQQVGIKFVASEKAIFLNPPDVKEAVGIDIHEVELLAGSHINPIFYKKGETMHNGKECYKDEYFIKDFNLIPFGTIDQMRKINSHKLDPYNKIHDVFNFERNDKTITGFEVEGDKKIYANANIVRAITKLQPHENHILVGSFVFAEYYEVGENIFEGMNRAPSLCRKPNTVLKQLNIRMVDTADAMRENFDQNESNYLHTSEFDHSYGKYGGVHGFDDMTIEVAFEGDPANIWNIL